ncbi:DNA polymerase II [Shewanella sp. 202IG2-18]|uniref:DNA polymerase II n=1 Tax=Parashewanella hymeniacidonis TaxID=2807618 RepID=UPI00195FDE55|nr:DNA polymerase II [Parashewanella hymeniacidonis]MBM7071271.1 DNA polymerase II [Parashewanella hymeniacidonis]
MSSSLTTVSGQVLTRRINKLRGQHFIEYFVATSSGPVLVRVDDANWVCFCKTNDFSKLFNLDIENSYVSKSLPLKDFNGDEVTAIYTETRQEQAKVKDIAERLNIPLYETGIKPEHRYLCEREIAFDAEFLGHDIHSPSTGIKQFRAQRVRPIQASKNYPLKSISLDFECSPQSELYSVGLYAEGYQKVIMVGKAQVKSPEYVEWVLDERELIVKLISWFQDYDPDIVIGWAVITFDLALLYKRALVHSLPLTIGRASSKLSWKVEGKYRPETLSLPGRVVLDGIDWLKAAFYKFESFSLENVSRELLHEGKAIDDVKGRGTKIADMFEHDKLSLAHYNLTDCRLVWDIFEKTDLWNFAIARSQLTGLELGRTAASVAAFNNLYFPKLHKAGYVAPQSAVSDGLESPGGYVMDSIPGLYNNVLVLDFKSLYPNIIRTFLIDPKGLVEGLKEADNSVAGFLGAKFSRKRPILPQLIANLSEQREIAKQEKNAPLSHAIKIIMNSMYGVLGTPSCVFHDAKLASSITMRGHELMKQTKQWIEELGHTVIYGDTDSTFVWAGDHENPDALGGELAELINKKWKNKLLEEYGLESYLELEFETHFDQFHMPTLRGSELGSKKRYVGTKKTKEEIEIVFKGMENVRNDWSKLAKRIQFELYQRLFLGQKLGRYLSQQIEMLKSGKLDNELVFKRKLSRNVEEYTAKSSPHVRVANQLFKHTSDTKFLKRGATIKYVNTLQGPQSISYRNAEIDYDYYIEKQIIPIAESLFDITGENLNSASTGQLSMF